MIILALRVALRREIAKGEYNYYWRDLEKKVADNFGVGHNYVRDLRHGLFAYGNLFVYGGSKRGTVVTGPKSKNTKLTNRIMKESSMFINSSYSNGRAITTRKVRAFFYDKYNGMQIHRTTVGRAIEKMELAY